MRRREFISLLGSAVAWPVAARAEQAERMRRIAVIMSLADDDDAEARLSAFREELERLGWSEGHNIHIEYRFAAGRSEQYLPLAKELIALRPDVILSQSTAITALFQGETRTIPIVFASVSDPIGSGFVANLARPGGNITGTLLYEPGIMGKWLAMLKEIVPQLTRAALIGNPKATPFDYFVKGAQAAAPELGIQLVPAPIENTDASIQQIIAFFAATPNGGLALVPDPTTIAIARRDLVISLAKQHRPPAVYPYRLFVEAGGLMSYGVDQIDSFRLPASYIDRILRGAKPADLPVQAPTKYETLVNLKAAKAIGLSVPASLLVRADEVIE